MAKQLNIGNTTSPVDVNITESLKINGKTAVVSSSESLGESTRPLYLENGELLAGSQQYIFWEEDSGANPTGSNPYVLKAGDTMTGPLILNGNPSLALAAVPKQYVDGNFLTNTDALNLFYTKEGSNGKFLSLEGGTMNGHVYFNDSIQLYFKGKNNTTSPRAQIGFQNQTISGYKMHCDTSSANYQNSGAFYIQSNGYDGASDTGGIAIDNEGVTVYGAGDPGSNFTGVFRVINEDNVDAGPIFYTLKNGHSYGTALHAAVWNDYAEYRKADSIEPGRCIIENGDDTLSLSSQRMQSGANIISDTFGFSIGETDQAKTPIAVSGRVLAYTWEDREIYREHIGEFVCSGPQGTVSLMTTEEYHKYPHCAIGTVSAVPDYEEWGTGKVKVNERVWIKIL